MLSNFARPYMDETQNRINDTCMVGMLYECQVLAAALLVDQLFEGILGLRYEADFEGTAEPSTSGLEADAVVFDDGPAKLADKVRGPVFPNMTANRF